MPENNDVRSIYPPMPTTDPLLTNVNMRAMPGHEDYFVSGPSGEQADGSDSPMNPSVAPTEHPEVEKTPAVRSLSRPTDIKAVAEGDNLKLSATAVSGEDTKKIVFHVDGKQAAVLDTEGGDVEVTVPAAPGEHEVRAFAFTGEKSGPWSESVSVTV
jgi:hypothetical protein